MVECYHNILNLISVFIICRHRWASSCATECFVGRVHANVCYSTISLQHEVVIVAESPADICMQGQDNAVHYG